MKKARYLFLSSTALAFAVVLTACGGSEGGGGDVPPVAEFSFSASFIGTKTDKIYVGTNELLEIKEVNPGEVTRTYTYTLTSGSANFISVSYDSAAKLFTVTPEHDSGDQKVGIRITEQTSGKKFTKFFYVGERYDAANTGYNFSADTEKKSEILGKLEEYAMKNYLTGITLFENGGYIRKAERVHYGTEKEGKNTYVTGYGFGLLAEGYLETDPTKAPQPAVSGKKEYLQSAQSSDPGNISGWNASGSQIGDLYGYMTSSFWGTKLNSDKTGYEWYPVLAAENCLDPIPQDGKPTDTIHKKYRVYVKTGNTPDGPSGEKYSIAYRSINGEPFDGRPVALEDYITTFRLLLTQSSKLSRGAELATDTSYGFKGAYAYFRKTEKANDEQAEGFWSDMTENDQLGIVAGTDAQGEYIDFEFVNPIDQFTAKYTLSSSLYSPIPKEFLESIGGGSWIAGGEVFGTGSKTQGTTKGAILNNVIGVGPYFLEEWVGDQEIVFKRNDNWFEYVNTKGTDNPRYRIEGVHFQVISAAQQRDDAIYDEFNLKHLDQTSIPVSRMSERKPTDDQTKGDATFKLNVNSCDQTRWDNLFWSTKYPDVEKPTNRYLVKPWMSNKNFLNGLFWSINRSDFAETRGAIPSYNYFADAYLDDPIAGHSYNASEAHELAERGFDPSLPNSNYGFNQAKATAYFADAVDELVASGDITLGTTINKTKIYIDIWWMYQNDETTYGEDIANYFTDAFNNSEVGKGCVELEVRHNAESQWEQVYNDHLMVGVYDLGFGAISGNTLNPLNFMEVLKSDNSSGFTLNWGVDTSKVDPDDPIVFEVKEDGVDVKKEWSFDSAWATADHGAVVKDGEPVDSVQVGYTTKPTTPSGTDTNRLANGAIMLCNFEFVEVDPGVEFEITRVQLSLMGYGSITIDESNIERIYVDDDPTKAIIGFKIIFDNETVKEEYENMTFSKYVNKMLFDGLKLQKVIDNLDPTDPKYAEKKAELENPLAYDYYDAYWWVDVYYNITISGSVPTENYYKVTKTKQTKALSFASLGGR